MSKTFICCIANCRNLAELIVDQLKFYGISNRDISVLYPDVEKNGWKPHHFGYGADHSDPENVPAGAGSGSAIGGALAWIPGIGSLSVPGIGAFIAAGPIIASLSGAAVGATSGGIAEGLTALGISVAGARYYEDRIRQGSILISVHTDNPAGIMQTKFIFSRGRAEDVILSSKTPLPPLQKIGEQTAQEPALV